MKNSFNSRLCIIIRIVNIFLLFLICNAYYCFSINCFCSNHAPENNQKVDDNNCDTTCVGDSSKTCGGEDRIQIYDLISKNFNIYIKWLLVVLIKYINFNILLKGKKEETTSTTPDIMHFDDSFEYLNLNSAWSHDVFIAQEPVCTKYNFYNTRKLEILLYQLCQSNN